MAERVVYGDWTVTYCVTRKRLTPTLQAILDTVVEAIVYESDLDSLSATSVKSKNTNAFIYIKKDPDPIKDLNDTQGSKINDQDLDPGKKDLVVTPGSKINDLAFMNGYEVLRDPSKAVRSLPDLVTTDPERKKSLNVTLMLNSNDQAFCSEKDLTTTPETDGYVTPYVSGYIPDEDFLISADGELISPEKTDSANETGPESVDGVQDFVILADMTEEFSHADSDTQHGYLAPEAVTRPERLCSRCQKAGLTPEEQISFFHELPLAEKKLISAMLSRIRSLDDVDFWIRRWAKRYPDIDIVLCLSEFAVYCRNMDSKIKDFAVSRLNLENLFAARQRIYETQVQEREKEKASRDNKTKISVYRADILEKRREWAYNTIKQEKGDVIADKYMIGIWNQVIPYWEAYTRDADLFNRLSPLYRREDGDFFVPLSGEENSYFASINTRAAQAVR